jgi:hypothetical protein
MLELIREELLGRGALPGNMIALNFEDVSLDALKNPKALHDCLKAKMDAMEGRAYLFLDELQEVEGWESCINSLRVNSDADIYGAFASPYLRKSDDCGRCSACGGVQSAWTRTAEHNRQHLRPRDCQRGGQSRADL